MNEHRMRSLAKALSWRIMASFITGLIVLGLTHEYRLAVGAGFVDAVVKIFAYYAHERMWLMIPHGRKIPIRE